MARKLLLADDSVTIQRVIELIFSGEDVQVIAVGDGELAIGRISTERPDIVLADIGMPKRSGYEVAAFVKADPALKHIPVLLLAGAFEPVDEAKAKQAGSDGVLVKPFEPQQVIARVRELLEKSASPAGRAPELREAGRVTPLDPKPASAPARTLEFPKPVPPPSAIPAGPSQAAGAEDDSLDDYFDRLDAAFATLDSISPVGQPIATARDEVPGDDALTIPTLDELLGRDFTSAAIDLPLTQSGAARLPQTGAGQGKPAEPLATRPVPPPARESNRPEAPLVAQATPAAPVKASGDVLADTFSMLLAAEQDPGAPTVRLAPVALAKVELSDAQIDEIARRIIERLAPDAIRPVVADIVSVVAERLVREEIERIRRQ